MLPRLAFIGIAAFWVTMNVLLWRAEFGASGGDTEVPLELVWHKILTAPDPSSLSVYQQGNCMGFCELSSGVGQQMAAFEEGRPPPEGFSVRSGYRLHVGGNVSFGDFTNRLKFEARVRFNHLRRWEEMYVKLTMRNSSIEIHSVATNQTAHVKLSSEGLVLMEREMAFSELSNPGTAVRMLSDNSVLDLFAPWDYADILPKTGQKIEWDARRTRVKFGSENVPIYRLSTTILGRPVTVDVSTLGEVLRIRLPDNICAQVDEWGKP